MIKNSPVMFVIYVFCLAVKRQQKHLCHMG